MDDLGERVNPSIRVIETVAGENGVEPEDLAPLYEAIDPDALDRLVGTSHGRAPSDLTVRFRYEGYSVTVDGTGHVTLSLPN